MKLIITDADIKTAAAPNESNLVTLHITLRSDYGDKGYVGKLQIGLPDVRLARELFDAVRRGELYVSNP